MNDQTGDRSRSDDMITVHRDAVRFFAAVCFIAGALSCLIIIAIVCAVAGA